MTIEVGDIIEGKVNGLTKFGCFIDLEGGESGLV
ncbi:MAG: S1 RNA-binding domain-containing protein, partial [Firmicutes bacterium]|nr:S1 RNA-binding domain-containing protein [Bacillota bacterium]